jgi:hypothetical protein
LPGWTEQNKENLRISGVSAGIRNDYLPNTNLRKPTQSIVNYELESIERSGHKLFYGITGFEAVTAVVMKSCIFWDIKPCRSFENQLTFRCKMALPFSG